MDTKKTPPAEPKKRKILVNGKEARPDTYYKPIDVQKALSLRIHQNLSYGQIGKILGHGKPAIRKALNRFTNLLKNPEQVTAYNKNKADVLSAAEFKLLSEIVNPDKIKKASINNIAYAFSAVSREQHLAAGEATENIQYYHLKESEKEVNADIEKLEKELAGN